MSENNEHAAEQIKWNIYVPEEAGSLSIFYIPIGTSDEQEPSNKN